MINEEAKAKNHRDDREQADQIGENTGSDTEIAREAETDQHEQENSDSSNKEKGPEGEGL